MVVKRCIRCSFRGDIKFFVKGKNHCKKCHNEAERESYQIHKKKRAVQKKKYHKTYLKRPEVKERMKKNKQKESYKEYSRNYARTRVQNNIEERIKVNLRNRIRHSVKKRNECSAELIGCPMELLLEWLEFNFTDEMSWDNYGSYWHMDHIQPCSSFDMNDKEERLQCFNWKNIAPLEASENERKHAKIDKKVIRYYEQRADDFVDYYIEKYDLEC